MAVNLTKQLRSGRFVPILKNCLIESGLLPARLSLEMTETVFLASSERMVNRAGRSACAWRPDCVGRLGTGYSSLTYLRGFDVDGIKIDASFTRDLPGSQKVAAIVRTIGRLASDMNIYVVAEGVETVEQLNWLRGNGIAFAQGYLLGRPGEDTAFSGAEPGCVAGDNMEQIITLEPLDLSHQGHKTLPHPSRQFLRGTASHLVFSEAGEHGPASSSASPASPLPGTSGGSIAGVS